MQDIWNNLSGTGQATVVAAAIALTGVVLSVLVSALVSRRSSYISSVTVERSKWIDKLRTNIADLLGALGHVHVQHSASQSYRNTPTHFDDLRRIDTLIATITLQLNPRGEVDKNMIRLLEQMPREADTSPSQFRAAERALILHSQFLLKEEWEKVKYESRLAITRPFAWCGRCRRAREYREFCRTPDSFISQLPPLAQPAR
jgi:hypothetical protein